MESSAGWNVHLVVLGALAALGIALTVYDYAGPSGGGWISLRGLVSGLYWMAFVAFAIASSLTFGLLRARLGVPASYVTAVLALGAIALVVWLGSWLIEGPLSGPAKQRLMRDLASRLTLEAWSVVEQPDGLMRFTVAVRGGARDGTVEFQPSASIGGFVAVERAERTSERPLRAGERVVLEATAYRSTQGAFESFDLFFVSWIRDVETGFISYATDAKEDTIVGAILKRPLPPPQAVPQQ